MSDELPDRAPDEFDNMNIAQARSAAKLYGVALSREMTLEDIRNAMRTKLKDKTGMVRIANTDNEPEPGRWRIILDKTTELGAVAGKRPVDIMVQGYRCTMPRNIAIDVPEKVVRALETSYHYIAVDRDDGIGGFESVRTYPFRVITMTPGPDPSPGYEKIKENWYQARKRFRDKFGYWPKNQAMLREAIKEGHITAPALPTGSYERPVKE